MLLSNPTPDFPGIMLIFLTPKLPTYNRGLTPVYKLLRVPVLRLSGYFGTRNLFIFFSGGSRIRFEWVFICRSTSHFNTPGSWRMERIQLDYQLLSYRVFMVAGYE